MKKACYTAYHNFWVEFTFSFKNQYGNQVSWHCPYKFFMYVTKTCANLSTYSRKPDIYNGTIIFEIDIMKNSSPLNLKFTFFATVKTKITLLFSVTHRKQLKKNQPKHLEKIKFDKDINWFGEDFFMISISKIMMPL